MIINFVVADNCGKATFSYVSHGSAVDESLSTKCGRNVNTADRAKDDQIDIVSAETGQLESAFNDADAEPNHYHYCSSKFAANKSYDCTV